MPRPLASLLPLYKGPTLASHRGYGKRGPIAENTLAAFKKSTDAGFKAHELDVRRTKDNVAVLLHGPKLESTTSGFGRIENMPFRKVAELNFSHYLPNEPPQGPLTLTKYLTEIPKDVITNIELKRDWWDLSRGLEEAVAAAVMNAQATNRVLFSSFNWLALRRIKKLLPQCGYGLLLEKGKFYDLLSTLGLALVKPDSIHLHYTMATPKRVHTYQKKGLAIALWTVNDEGLIRHFFEQGVNFVITDRIELIEKFS